MPNLRIVTKNALRQAASLTASSTAGNLAMSSLAAAVKSSLHRFTGTNGSYRATWAAPARIGCAALPFCNWSPTAKQRVRVSKEKSATNLQPQSETSGGWVAAGSTPPGVTPVPEINGVSAVRIDFLPGMLGGYAGCRAGRTQAGYMFPIQAGVSYANSLFVMLSRPLTGSESVQIYCTGTYGGPGVGIDQLNSGAYVGSFSRVLLPASVMGLTGVNAFVIYLSGPVNSPLSVFLTRMQAEVDRHTSYYPSLETFTSRASVGTYIGSDGIIKTAAANEARMQYDPMNPFAPPRLLLEAAATNYANGSETLIGWFGTPTVSSSDKRYRGIPYKVLAKSAAIQNENMGMTLPSPAAGTVYTATIAMRSGSVSIANVGLYNGSSWGGASECKVDVLEGPGVIGAWGALASVSNLSPDIDTVICITRVYTSNSSASLLIYPGTTASSTIGDSILVTRVQVEDGSVVYGPELITNGTFDTNTIGWVAGNASSGLSVVGGKLRLSAVNATAQPIATCTVATVAGRAYQFGCDVNRAGTTANAYLQVFDGNELAAKSAVNGTHLQTFVAKSSTTTLRLWLQGQVTGNYVDFDNVTIREVTPVPIVTSYIPTTTAAATRAADVYTSAPGVRPDGYIDHWQSYDYDSGWVLACPASAVELEGFTAAQAASAYAYGGGACARHWLPQQLDATGLAVDIADPDNLQGYIEAACMVVGPVWSPRYNASGTSVSVIDRTEVSRSAAGDQLADPGTISRKVPVDLRAMPEADRAKFLELVRNSRAHPILMSVFPEHPDLALERDFMVYGRRTKDSDIAYQFAGAYSTTLEIEEI